MEQRKWSNAQPLCDYAMQRAQDRCAPQTKTVPEEEEGENTKTWPAAKDQARDAAPLRVKPSQRQRAVTMGGPCTVAGRWVLLNTIPTSTPWRGFASRADPARTRTSTAKMQTKRDHMT
jgi:hypothetical protein